MSKKREQRLVEIIIDERKRANIRQIDLAKLMRKSQAWVARLENGRRALKFDEVLTLSEKIGFDVHKAIKAVQGVDH